MYHTHSVAAHCYRGGGKEIHLKKKAKTNFFLTTIPYFNGTYCTLNVLLDREEVAAIVATSVIAMEAVQAIVAKRAQYWSLLSNLMVAVLF